MTTIFTRIVNGEIPADKVLEDDDHLAFLDIVPVQPGHVLCIPKHEVGYLFDMAPEAQAKLWDFVRRVEAGVREATGCKRVVMMVVGWEVPHVHVHLIPTNQVSDFPVPPKLSIPAPERAAMAAKIREVLGGV
ncbi:MAG: HIT family protein [Planctomycetota bacterium]|nr:HIT family protein [Planctomycetota bacterium]MCB9825769.1 HIT family protein [Planctomycetota bacterium]